MDVDGIEYDQFGNALALFELKHWKDGKENEFQLMCLTKTANKLGIPFFKIKYYPSADSGPDLATGELEPNQDWGFMIFPINDLAIDFYQQSKLKLTGKLNQQEYEIFLLNLRSK